MNLLPGAKDSLPILAAGGIVLEKGSRPRIAIVRLRRDKSWVLPKGKLNPGEHALAAARREVLEETGHQVSVHGFLGSMLYSVDGRIKIVQFWHMRVVGRPMREPMDDIKAVKWLPLKQAVEISRALTKRCSSRMWGRLPSRQLGNLRATSASSRIFTITVSGGDRACGLRQPHIDGYGGVL